ncbi:Acetyltransferase (GNAT) family protein [Collimonas sp. OK242]|jgi:ribosomal protein S18 acetylase RimI-like enzyme|uniref:GNAT family N-acetyltransferase n=1 Tax=Collimonas sp. OK242 TaxID=1798195 RepID=UPI000894CA38|nr:GNAT family N-acetyltransferase [Collimonas sp. OK242]SDY50463.1 Acetyltransferase (GNAT) family protein [Collimonas sp. OK242]
MSTPSADFDLIRSLEERAFNAWPAQKSALCGGWLLRLSEGYTKRANSANALRPAVAFDETLQVVEHFYARHGLPAIFRLSPLAGAEPDRALDQAGYRKIDRTLVMTAPLATSAQVSTAHDVVLEATAGDAWSAGFARANGIPSAARAAHDRTLAAITMPAAFATLIENETPVAYGLAVAENGAVGLFDIVVAPDARRRGVAARLVAALLEWGQAQRATRAYLQVLADNLPAIALYRKLGFDEQYQYHYRIRP